MNFFRNRSVQVEGWITIGLLFLAALIGWKALAAGLAFGLLHWGSLWKRYRRIAGLSEEIDQILHGEEALRLNEYREGELAILESQVYKMTVRLRDQSQIVIKEKTYLADSLADISHQLRTPLTSLQLVAAMLQRSGLSEERKKELVQEMYRLLSRMNWQIQTLLKISRLDANTILFQKRPITMKRLVELALQPLMIQMELREQQIQMDVPPDIQLCLDEVWTAEAIGNIFKNCMEEMGNRKVLFVQGRENAVFAQLVIEDEGPGIRPEDLPHLFERFYRGQNAGENSMGIGLALSRMILAKQQGSVRAENRRQGGARFIIQWSRLE